MFIFDEGYMSSGFARIKRCVGGFGRIAQSNVVCLKLCRSKDVEVLEVRAIRGKDCTYLETGLRRV